MRPGGASGKVPSQKARSSSPTLKWAQRLVLLIMPTHRGNRVRDLHHSDKQNVLDSRFDGNDRTNSVLHRNAHALS
jgi:hypothetical protein